MFKSKSFSFKSSKSFTLIEIIVVLGIMGMITGGMLASMRHIIDAEILLKDMQKVEEESRFILDLFAQDAQYSELDANYQPSGNTQYISSDHIAFNLTETRQDIFGQSGSSQVLYKSDPKSGQQGPYSLVRELKSNNNVIFSSNLNTVQLNDPPEFRVETIIYSNEITSYLVTVSLVFKIEAKAETILIPIQTSVVSRVFEF